MTDIPEHLLWLHERYGARLSKALLERDGVALAPGAAIAEFGRADPTQGLKLTDWLVRTYVEEQSFRWEDVRSGRDSTVGKTLELFVSKRGTLPTDRRNINLYESPGALWNTVGGNVVPEIGGRSLRRADRERARQESTILVEDHRGTIAVPLTEFASCWWGRGTRWCTAADKDNAFSHYNRNAQLYVMVLPDGRKAQFHPDRSISFMDAADDVIKNDSFLVWQQLLDPVVEQAVPKCGLTLEYASDGLAGNRDLVMAAVTQNGLALQHASTDLKADRAVVLAAVSSNGDALKHANSRFRADRDVVMAAVSQNGLALAHASIDLRADRDVVLAAVSIRTRNDLEIHPKESSNPSTIQNGQAIQHASADLKADRNVVLAAVTQDGWALRYVNKKLRADRDIVVAAISQCGLALEYADPGLQSDRSIVLLAIAQDGWAAQFASIYLQEDKGVILASVTQNGRMLQCCDSDWRADRDVVLAAVTQNGFALQYAGAALWDDRDVVLTAVSQNGWALQHASTDLRSDRDVVLAAVSQNRCALQYASEDLREDDDLRQTKKSLDSTNNGFQDEGGLEIRI